MCRLEVRFVGRHLRSHPRAPGESRASPAAAIPRLRCWPGEPEIDGKVGAKHPRGEPS